MTRLVTNLSMAGLGVVSENSKVLQSRAMNLVSRTALSALSVCLCVTQLHAQPVGTEAAERRTKEATQQAGKTISAEDDLMAAAEALPPVTFSQVLEAPDDPAVNLRYAQDLILKGNVQLAAATVERILINYPDADSVRLLYAILLYRMDVLDDSAAQLDILEARSSDDAILKEVARYRKLIDERNRPIKRSAAISIGMHYDRNRNAFPDQGTFLIGGAPIQGTTGEVDDFGHVVIAATDMRMDTNGQQLQEIFADAAFLYDNQVEIDELDVRALLLNGGLTYKSRYGTLVPGLHAALIQLDREKYSRDYAVSLRGERPVLNSKVAAYAEVRAGWRKFNNTRNLPFAREQSGQYHELTVGGRRALDNRTLIHGAVSLNSVDAINFESYESYELSLDFTRILPADTFLTGSVTVEKQFYQGPDPFITQRTRHDLDTTYNLTYGVPVANITTHLGESFVSPPFLEDVVLTVSVEYQNSNSNIPNFDYDNVRGQFLLNRRWDF